MFLEQRRLAAGHGQTEVFVCEPCCYAAAWGAIEKPDLDEERFVDFFECVFFFSQGCGQRAQTHRAATVFVDDRQQQLAVDLIEAVRVNLKHGQRGVCRGAVDVA